MKKIISLIIILTILVALFGCNNQETDFEKCKDEADLTTCLELNHNFNYLFVDNNDISELHIQSLIDLNIVLDEVTRYIIVDEQELPIFNIWSVNELDLEIESRILINMDNVKGYTSIYSIIDYLFPESIEGLKTGLSKVVFVNLNNDINNYDDSLVESSVGMLNENNLLVCLELQSFCFDEDEVPQQAVTNTEIFSYNFITFVSIERSGLEDLIDNSIPKHEFIELYNDYLFDFLENHNIYDEYEMVSYIRFIEEEDLYYYNISSNHANWKIEKDYEDMFEGLVFDDGFLSDSKLSIYEFILDKESEFNKIDLNIDSETISNELSIKIYNRGEPFAYITGNGISIANIVYALSHEYVHSLDIDSGIYVSWIIELRASYFSSNDKMAREVGDYFINDCVTSENISGDDCSILKDTYNEFTQVYERSLNSDIDYLDFNDLYIYNLNEYDGVYINQMATSNSQRISFAHYFIETYGLDEFNNFCKNYSVEIEVDGLTIQDLINDWEQNIINKFS